MNTTPSENLKPSLKVVLSSFVKLLAYEWKIDKLSIFMSIFVAAIMSFNTIFLILLPKLFVDSLLEGEPRTAISLLGIYAVVYIVILVLLGVSGYLIDILGMKRKYKVAEEMMFRNPKLKLEHVDNGPFMDYYTRTFNNIQSATDSVKTVFGSFVHSMFNIIAIVSMLIWINNWLLFMLFLVLISDILVSMATSKIEYSSQVAAEKEGKRANSLARIFFLPNSIREIKTLRYEKVTQAKFTEMKDRAISIRSQFLKKAMKLSYVGGVINELNPLVPMSYFGYNVINGSMDISSYFMYNTAYNELRQSLKSLMDVLPKIYSTGLYSKDYFKFMEDVSISESSGDQGLEIEAIESIEFRDVSFKYQTSNEYSLKKVSFSVNKGDRVAFIGRNGAGKTTIMKIMMGLYSPTEGNILINGKDISLYNLDSLRKTIAVLFQDFYLFPFSIREVLGINSHNELEALNLISRFGLDKKIASLKDGLDTGISPEFYDQFTNFSGGESQKLAIIRLLLQTTASCLVLDEPTSNLDPESEYLLYKQILSEISNDNITFVVSHRLVMTTKMDKIFVVDDGSIVESGTHLELFNSGGVYAELFSIQSDKFSLEA